MDAREIKFLEMEKEVKKSFIEYSMSVIAARALPDVRDGMKPRSALPAYRRHGGVLIRRTM